MRRWLHALGWVWKRAQLVARDDDPQRVEKLARIRHTLETLGNREVVLFADELDIHLLPKVGYQWMAQGETVRSRPSVPVNPFRQQTRHFGELVHRMIVRPYSLPVR